MNERSDKAPTQERRKSLRVPLIVQRFRVQDDRKTFFGYATNISSGGLFIGTTNPKEVGSRFLLDVPFPEPIGRTVRCNCEVVWCRTWAKGSTLEPGMGIRFLDLPAEEKELIDRWIEATRQHDRPWRGAGR